MAGSNYCYFGQSCAVNSPWTGNANAGLQNENNGAWPGAPTPSGTYYAFIQNTGSFGQTFSLNAGTYALSWLAAGRPAGCCQGNQQYNVLFDGNVIYTGSTTTGQAFTNIGSNPFVVTTSGNHTLTFQGLSAGPDNTAFIDNVSLAAVPEPATWAMMMLGFGMVGYGLRRRSAKVAFA
ncbi:MAG: FxDxF family PEP-CTERM protein [Sphingomonas sp.]|nr:FxDxF family PEP-CTERM protein [Sphingomonas sp.]